MNEAKARCQVERIISEGGGTQATFLTKMFKFQESMEQDQSSRAANQSTNPS